MMVDHMSKDGQWKSNCDAAESRRDDEIQNLTKSVDVRMVDTCQTREQVRGQLITNFPKFHAISSLTSFS